MHVSEALLKLHV